MDFYKFLRINYPPTTGFLFVEMLEQIENLPEFSDHEMIVFVHDAKSGLKGFVAVHRGNSIYPAFGATREWAYSSEVDALRDALKLAKTMSYKAAMAHVECGGAKGVIFKTTDIEKKRKLLLKAYARQVNYLKGHFITGADVGISNSDLGLMRRISPYFVGIKSNPVRFTALGLLYSIKACCNEIFGTEDLSGRSFAIQGLGKIGLKLLSCLYPKTKNIFVSDINRGKLESALPLFPRIKVVSPRQIYKQRVDVFSPCALSNCIAHKNLVKLNCKIIVGGANNQLEDDEVGEILYKLGILYAPDYIVNAGGLMSVFEEYKNKKFSNRIVTKKVKEIRETLTEIIEESKKKKKATNLIANEQASRLLERRYG